MKKKPKRDRPVVVRMSKDEADLVEKEAEKIGLSVSGFIRMLIHRAKEKSV